MPGERAEQDHQISFLSRSPLHPRRRWLRACSHLRTRPAWGRCDPDHRCADKACRACCRSRLYARRPHAGAARACRKVALRITAVRRGWCVKKGVLMEHEVLRKLRSATIKAGHDALVAFSQDNVTYTAGFLVPSHASNRFRRTITVLAGDAFAAQIVVNVEENLARSRSRFSDIRAYNQFTDDPADVLADALVEAGVASGRIAIELDYMPAQDYIRLRERLPAAQLVPCRELYFNVRMIKTDEEIAILKAVGALTDRVV